MTNQRPHLDVAAAVEAFDITKRTLQRRLAAGDIPGSIKTEHGRWSIPIDGLHAAGVTPRQTWRSNESASAPISATRAVAGATLRDEPQKNTEVSAPNGAPAPTAHDAEGATEVTELRAMLEQGVA